MVESHRLFEGEFVGMHDREGNPIREGDLVELYHRGLMVICRVVYVPEWAMFCLQWPDGYRNKFPMNPEKYKVLKS